MTGCQRPNEDLEGAKALIALGNGSARWLSACMQGSAGGAERVPLGLSGWAKLLIVLANVGVGEISRTGRLVLRPCKVEATPPGLFAATPLVDQAKHAFAYASCGRAADALPPRIDIVGLFGTVAALPIYVTITPPSSSRAIRGG